MKVSQQVLAVLDQASFDGNYMTLTGQLDRKLYVDTMKVIEAAGGKWNRKAGAHHFEGDAAEAIEPIILTGEYTRSKQDIGQFDTPPDLAANIAGLARIAEDMDILEPSAGLGNLAKAARECGGDVMCVEIDEKRARSLATAGFRSVVLTDFLSLEGLQKFDRVLMNPPFAGQVDIDHVLHAAKFVKPGGRLVSIMSAGILFRANKKTASFRDFIAQLGGSIERLPDDSFKASGTSVSTCVVSFDKPAE